MRPEEFLNLRRAYSEIEHRYDLSEDEKIESLKEYLKQNIRTKLSFSKIVNSLSDEMSFKAEYERLVNLQLYNKAVSAGEKTYKSLIPCTSTKRTGDTCANTIRYTSNRGCTLCQKTNPENKRRKQEAAIEIIEAFEISENKTALVKELMRQLGMKKSAAYRVINLYKAGKPLYQTKKEPSIDEQSSSLVVKLATEHDDVIDLNQDYDYTAFG